MSLTHPAADYLRALTVIAKAESRYYMSPYAKDVLRRVADAAIAGARSLILPATTEPVWETLRRAGLELDWVFNRGLVTVSWTDEIVGLK